MAKATISTSNQQWLQQQYRPDITGLSVAVNHSLSTAAQVLQSSVPALTLPQWLAIFDMLNGHAWNESDNPDFLPSSVAECIEHDGLAMRFNVGPDFAQQLAGMTTAQLAAIEWTARRFWAGNWEGMSGYTEIMAALDVELAP